MHVSVDFDLCVGHGQCFARAPEIYASDNDGFCVVMEAEVEGRLAAEAKDGAECCPEHAISVEVER